MKNHKVFFHIDNQGDIFALVSGFSMCLMTQVLVNMVLDLVVQHDLDVYWAFTSTKINPADYLTRFYLKNRFTEARQEARQIRIDCEATVNFVALRYADYVAFLGKDQQDLILFKNDKKRRERRNLNKRRRARARLTTLRKCRKT